MNQTKNFLKASLLGGIFFGIALGLYTLIVTSSVIYGIGIAISFGVLFGIVMFIIGFFQNRSFENKKIEIIDGEKVIFYGPANHFVGKESVGGYLYLTKKSIMFKSHNFNLNVHEKIIPIYEISKIEVIRTLGLVPNGIDITAKNNVERFVVFNRKVWIENINNTIVSQHK